MDPSERERLTEDHFIRERLYGGSGSAITRYARLVLARPTFLALVRYELLGLFGPIPGALGLALRGVFWRWMFPRIGRSVVFGCRVTIRHPERLVLGDKVVIDDDALIDARGAGEAGLVLGDRVIVNRGAQIQAKVGGISIGAGSSVGANVKVISQAPIRIAENVSLAGGCVVAGGRYVVERTGDPADDKRRFTGGEIVIERNVRIGMNAIVEDGVHIGEAAIVAPGSVVVSDVEAGTVVSGFPARPWRERKTQEARDAAPRTPPSATPSSANGAAQVAARVRAYLEEVRFADFDDGTLTDTSSLFDQDILDSLSLVAMVTWIEKTFGVEVSDQDLVPENLESVERIARFVSARAGPGPGS